MDGFNCPECGACFADEFRLSYHRKLAHGIEPGSQIGQELKDAQRRIRNAVRVGVVSGTLTILLALFVVWIIEKVVQWSLEPAVLVGLPVAVLFGYFFYHGITGTNDYHRMSAGAVRSPETSVEADAIERAVVEQRQRDQEEARNDLGRWV